MKQTAVEWFYNKLITGKFTGKDTITFLFETAKEMEKEQIVYAFVECWKENMPEGYECKQSAEYYYKETYNQ